ncbi:lanthionine synthetase LanC family protein [Pontibacter actiniarum]|uniref:Lanthionine synthetase n=1 Tax=Pontibacter actiniarum TaxID=323450 RepID=A0A1X9YS67_9BACT|nr:lanthionine synthetase LanC family protein [Pontibacter actiniarum]ARS35719.1 hypothetical protein CA264_09850 [Pontibacter actiniarum]
MASKASEMKAVSEVVARKLVGISSFDPAAPDALYTGNLGKVVSLLTLTEYYQDTAFANQAVEIINRVVARVGTAHGLRFTTAMSNGLSGLGCVLLLLQRQEYLDRDGNTTVLLDWLASNVYEKSKAEIERGDLDPMYSSMGGVFYLAKYAALYPAGLRYIKELVELLATKIQENTHGRYIANKRHQQAGDYFINTGLAHGVCGMLLILTSVCQTHRYHAVEDLMRLLLGFLNALYKPYEPTEENFLFPRSVSNKGVPLSQARKHNANIGWCTSDLSVAYSILKAGNVLQNRDHLRFGNEVLTSFLNYNQSLLPIQEANFCHGYAGFSWLFKRCYDVTNREECQAVAQRWLGEAVRNGYPPGEDTLLNGNQGVYNVILRSSGMLPQAWDEVFFL